MHPDTQIDEIVDLLDSVTLNLHPDTQIDEVVDLLDSVTLNLQLNRVAFAEC
jgi:hypothetical protein